MGPLSRWNPGIKGNEEGDLLANQATSSLDSTAIKSLPRKYILKIINPITSQQWQIRWNSITNNKLKNIKKTVQKWPSPTNAGRIVDIVTTRARIGRTRLAHSLTFSIKKYSQSVFNAICHRTPHTAVSQAY